MATTKQYFQAALDSIQTIGLPSGMVNEVIEKNATDIGVDDSGPKFSDDTFSSDTILLPSFYVEDGVLKNTGSWDCCERINSIYNELFHAWWNQILIANTALFNTVTSRFLYRYQDDYTGKTRIDAMQEAWSETIDKIIHIWHFNYFKMTPWYHLKGKNALSVLFNTEVAFQGVKPITYQNTRHYCNHFDSNLQTFPKRVDKLYVSESEWWCIQFFLRYGANKPMAFYNKFLFKRIDQFDADKSKMVSLVDMDDFFDIRQSGDEFFVEACYSNNGKKPFEHQNTYWVRIKGTIKQSFPGESDVETISHAIDETVEISADSVVRIPILPKNTQRGYGLFIDGLDVRVYPNEIVAQTGLNGFALFHPKGNQFRHWQQIDKEREILDVYAHNSISIFEKGTQFEHYLMDGEYEVEIDFKDLKGRGLKERGTLKIREGHGQIEWPTDGSDESIRVAKRVTIHLPEHY